MKIFKFIIGILILSNSFMLEASDIPQDEGFSTKTWLGASVVPVVVYTASVLPALGETLELYSAGCVAASSMIYSLNPSFCHAFQNPAFVLCRDFPCIEGVAETLHVGIKFIGTCQDFVGIPGYNYLCYLEPTSFPVLTAIVAGGASVFSLYKAYNAWKTIPSDQ